MTTVSDPREQDKTDFGSAYRGVRERVKELVLSLPSEDLDRQVPACPDWTVKELVSHMTGIASDMLAGNVAEAGQKQWTQAQITKRRDRSIEEIVAEWDEAGVQIDEALGYLHPAAAAATVGDAATHEHDLRGAVGDRDARDTDAVSLAFGSYARFLSRRIRENNLPTLELKTESEVVLAGKEEPIGSVSGSQFELLRALTGRRTKDQIRTLEWSTDPEPFMEIFSSYKVTEKELPE